MPRVKKPGRNYVDNVLFTEAVVKHRNTVFAYKEILQELVSIYNQYQSDYPKTIIEFQYYYCTYEYLTGVLLNKPLVSRYIGDCIYRISRGLQSTASYCRYTYPDDLCSNAVENVLKYITNFDPEKSTNAFSYCTQIVYYSFLRTIANENKQTSIADNMITSAEFSAMFSGGELEPELMQSILEQHELRIRTLSKKELRV